VIIKVGKTFSLNAYSHIPEILEAALAWPDEGDHTPGHIALSVRLPEADIPENNNYIYLTDWDIQKFIENIDNKKHKVEILSGFISYQDAINRDYKKIKYFSPGNYFSLKKLFISKNELAKFLESEKKQASTSDSHGQGENFVNNSNDGHKHGIEHSIIKNRLNDELRGLEGSINRNRMKIFPIALNIIIEAITAIDPAFDRNCVQGEPQHLHSLCQNLSKKIFTFGSNTFHSYCKKAKQQNGRAICSWTEVKHPDHKTYWENIKSILTN